LAVGGWANDAFAMNAGHVRVYTILSVSSSDDNATAGNLTEGKCCAVFYGQSPEEMMSEHDLDVCAYCEPGFICRESVQPVGDESTFAVTGTEVNTTSRDCVSYNHTKESCMYNWISMEAAQFPCMSNETAQEFPEETWGARDSMYDSSTYENSTDEHSTYENITYDDSMYENNTDDSTDDSTYDSTYDDSMGYSYDYEYDYTYP
jgi:hypothetical protein